MKTKVCKAGYKDTTRNWFNRWSNKYDQTLGSIGFHRELLDLVAKSCRVEDCDKVLDIGCGTGLLSLKLLQKADCSITGLDISKEMLAIFKDKIAKLSLGRKINCRLMDITALNFKDNTFDLAVSSVVLHHLKNKLIPLRKIYKLLKPGGALVIGEIDMDSTGSHLNIKRLKRMLGVLEQEWIPALKDVGVEAFARMYSNGIKHILNQGEYCVSLKQWAAICRRAGFARVIIKRVPRYKCFGIVVVKKPG
ncbi:MAG: methyltransferase domain-containing protein [Candidatus Omnitrophica bacterium]|nr:methyltransferase domain-containing protein [Candidatus Omnitrophota bacterium]